VSAEFVVGDAVKFTAKFLVSIGLRKSNDPRVHGTAVVVAIEDPWVVIQWPDTRPSPFSPDDGLAPGQQRIHPGNIAKPRTAKAYDVPPELTATPAEWRAGRLCGGR
jgi:hypothetical protein